MTSVPSTTALISTNVVPWGRCGQCQQINLASSCCSQNVFSHWLPTSQGICVTMSLMELQSGIKTWKIAFVSECATVSLMTLSIKI